MENSDVDNVNPHRRRFIAGLATPMVAALGGCGNSGSKYNIGLKWLLLGSKMWNMPVYSLPTTLNTTKPRA